MKFQHHATILDTKWGPASSLSPGEYTRTHDRFMGVVLDKCIAHLGDARHGELITLCQHEIECEWHSIGRPYYKVYPEMLEMLGNTKMNFDAAYLNSPFEVFSVLMPGLPGLPASMLVRVHDRHRVLEDRRRFFEKHADRMPPAMRAGEEKMLADYERATERLTARKGAFAKQVGVTYYTAHQQAETIPFAYWEGETVESRLDEDATDGRVPEECRRIVRVLFPIAIAVAMFAINKHELVAPDIDRDILIRKFPGGRSKASQKLAEEKRQREAAKVKGWKVGSEIDLPRPRVITQGQPPERGGELTCGHVRSGHMKMQPCGPRNQDRKLIFVAPTIVRPDLPIRAQHGYRIRQKGEKV